MVTLGSETGSTNGSAGPKSGSPPPAPQRNNWWAWAYRPSHCQARAAVQLPFARRQSRLLGGAVHPCTTGAELRERLQALLSRPELRQKLAAIGRSRMGRAGGSARLAKLVLERLHGY